MPVSRLVLPTLLMVALVTGLSAPPSMGQIGIRRAAAPDVTLSFPLFSGESQSLELADYVAQRLRLGQAEISAARLYNVSRLLYDGLSGIYGVSNLLDTFDALPEPDKHLAAVEILRRAQAEGDLPDAALIQAAEELFLALDVVEAGHDQP